MSQAENDPTTPLPLPGDAPPRTRRGQAVAGFRPPAEQDIRIARPEEARLPPLPNAGGPRDILIGEAGVHLVLSRLMQWHMPAHAAGPGLAYDIIAEGGLGIGLIRLQVKTTARPPRGPCYRFRLTRGFHGSARGVFAYQAGDFDIAAFVALDIGRVLFQAFEPSTFAATPEDFLALDAERRSLSRLLPAPEEQPAEIAPALV